MSIRARLLCLATFAALTLVGCPSDPMVPADTGTPGTDGGPRDGGPRTDGGGSDGGGVDAPIDAPAPVCGDGAATGSETCDDGNTTADDGCSATCATELGWACSGTPSVCVETCGDGVVDGPVEECDDDNMSVGDGCTDACDIEPGFECTGTPSVCVTRCGDGVTAGDETCDDTNVAAGDGCDDECTLEAGWSCSGAPSVCLRLCGNAVLEAGEGCDDGDLVDGDGCDDTCTAEAGYTCTGMPSACVSACGDSVIAVGAEMCDDGNNFTELACAYGQMTCESCDSTCTVAMTLTGEFCGDGDVAVGIEACDDSNTTAGDGCSATCQFEEPCGNGTVGMGETCDDNNAVTELCAYGAMSCMVCDSTCHTVAGMTQRCGDMVVQMAFEQCDDGNMMSGDGCTACLMGTGELEPNDDGVVATGASGITGNDFDTPTAPATSIAVTNANANFATIPMRTSVPVNSIIASIGVAGDEDVFAIENNGTTNVLVRLDAWNLAMMYGVGTACGTSIDIGMNVRQADGMVVASNDDRNGAVDRCPGLSLTMTPGQRLYVHMMEFGDDAAVPAYALVMTSTPIVCGDGVLTGGEPCDDMNTANLDGCSSTCAIETGFNCIGQPSVCTAQAPNATCAGAIALGSTGTTTTTTTAGGGTRPTGTGCTGLGAGTVLWYSITIPALSATTLTATPGATVDASLQVRDTCAAATCSAGRNDAGVGAAESLTITNSTAADITRVVAVGAATAVNGTIGLSLTTSPLAPNAICAGAVSLGSSGSVTTPDTAIGGPRPTVTGCTGAGTGTVLWYSVTVPANSATTVTATGAGAVDASIQSQDTCGAAACTAARNAAGAGLAETLTFTNATGADVTRVVAVGAAGATNGALNVTVASAALAPNATCAGAVAATASFTTPDTAVGGARPMGTNCGTATGSVLWYSITVPAGTQTTIVATPTGADATIQVRDTCAATTCGSSVNAATGTGAETLVVTNTTAAAITRVVAIGAATGVNGTIAVTVTNGPLPYQSIPLACTDMTGATGVTFIPGTTFTNQLDEGATMTAALPFTVPLYGSAMTHYSIGTNGHMGLFTSMAGSIPPDIFTNPTAVPSTAAPNGVLAPFWDDLLTTAGSVRTLTTGAAGSRVFTVEWAAGFFGGTGLTMTFQVQLYETGPIEFHYCSVVGTPTARVGGAEATIATENATGTVGSAYSINTAAAVTYGMTALRWTIP